MNSLHKSHEFCKSIPLKVDIFQSPDSIFRIILQYNMLCYCHYSKELKCVDIFQNTLGYLTTVDKNSVKTHLQDLRASQLPFDSHHQCDIFLYFYRKQTSVENIYKLCESYMNFTYYSESQQIKHDIFQSICSYYIIFMFCCITNRWQKY